MWLLTGKRQGGILLLLSGSQVLLNIYMRNLTAVSLHLSIIHNVIPLATQETFKKLYKVSLATLALPTHPCGVNICFQLSFMGSYNLNLLLQIRYALKRMREQDLQPCLPSLYMSLKEGFHVSRKNRLRALLTSIPVGLSLRNISKTVQASLTQTFSHS